MLFLYSKCLKAHRYLIKIPYKNSSQQESYLKHINQRCMSYNLRENISKKNKFIPFNDVVKMRQQEAEKSILVQVQSSLSYKELYSYCNAHGTVNQMFHYCVGVEPLHFILVEFTKDTDISKLLSASSHVDDFQVVPVHSQFLWFKASKTNPKLKSNHQAKLNSENSNVVIKDIVLREHLKDSEDISDQMRKLHNLTKLNDIGIRLRFLAARQIEIALKGMFPDATALPFGSSINGYGKMGCDLDLVFRLNRYQINSEEHRLMFQCKGISGNERTVSQRYMEAMADILQLFLPGCTQVRRILQARVPIIKYYQQFVDVECDLSMSNLSGVYMSEFLYIMSCLDERVKPLVFTIRKWAHSVGLTNSSPGRWISNFSLTLLVLAFLQKPSLSHPILPTLNKLVQQAGPNDVYVTDDGINCTFLRNIDNLKFATKNNNTLKDLLKEFFEYYSQFDFTTKAISLNEGCPITKPEHSPMYIINPLERCLNVSKNVSLEELERFKMEVRNASWILESEESNNHWGILSLFENKKKVNLSYISSQKQQKLLEVSKLFEDEPKNTDEMLIKDEINHENVKRNDSFQNQQKKKSKSSRR